MLVRLRPLLATIALALAAAQVGLALWMYGKLPLRQRVGGERGPGL